MSGSNTPVTAAPHPSEDRLTWHDMAGSRDVDLPAIAPSHIASVSESHLHAALAARDRQVGHAIATTATLCVTGSRMPDTMSSG